MQIDTIDSFEVQMLDLRGKMARSTESLKKNALFEANSLKNHTLSITHLAPKTLPSLVQAFKILPSLVQKLVKTIPLPS